MQTFLKMDVNGSTAGTAGAGLALASRYFHDLKYLEIAEVAVQMYYIQDFLRGYAGGGASEILQSPDSEAPWDMLESCMALYEVTGNREWVNKAKFATDMLSTWMVSYDYAFPRGSAMQRAGTHAAGSIFASSQNNHSAPGFYILSGDCLLKLFRATGDRRYAEMYRDTAHNVIQYVGAPHNPLRHESGYVTERVQLSDWEGNNVGSVSYGDSNMAWETLAALTCLENPGIICTPTTILFWSWITSRRKSSSGTPWASGLQSPTPPRTQPVSRFSRSQRRRQRGRLARMHSLRGRKSRPKLARQSKSHRPSGPVAVLSLPTHVE